MPSRVEAACLHEIGKVVGTYRPHRHDPLSDALEFIIRGDQGGSDQAVIQTNEQGLRVGERVALSYTDRVRITRAVNAPPVSYTPGGK